MTKVATIDTRRFLALLLIAAMLIAMIPIGVAVFPYSVLASDNTDDNEGTTGGSFTTNDSSSPPLINSVGLYTTANGSATDMDPTVEYWIKVDVTDNQMLAHLASVQVTIYYDADGSHGPVPTSVDNQTAAIITWTPPNIWTLTSMGGGTWSSHAGVTPTLNPDNTGTFVFHFIPGKVATETAGSADWDIYAVATDKASPTPGDDDESLTDLNMNWYGEINTVTGTVDFGAVSLNTQDVSGALSATYISNGNYSEQAKTASTWINGSNDVHLLGTNGTPGDGQFTLWAHDDSNNPREVFLTTAYKDIDGDETIEEEDGHTQSSIYLFLTLGPSGIAAGTYTGNINFAINNR